jgi:hypothetical protein
MQKKQSIRTDIRNQETFEDSEKECCECWENHMHTTKEDGWTECVGCRNCPDKFCSPLTDKCVNCGRKLLRVKTNYRRGS